MLKRTKTLHIFSVCRYSNCHSSSVLWNSFVISSLTLDPVVLPQLASLNHVPLLLCFEGGFIVFLSHSCAEINFVISLTSGERIKIDMTCLGLRNVTVIIGQLHICTVREPEVKMSLLKMLERLFFSLMQFWYEEVGILVVIYFECYIFLHFCTIPHLPRPEILAIVCSAALTVCSPLTLVTPVFHHIVLLHLPSSHNLGKYNDAIRGALQFLCFCFIW